MITNKSLRLMTRLFVLSLVIPIFSLNSALVQAQNEPLGSAAFTISNVTPVPNETVLFSAAYSIISGGGGNRCEWDFSDGAKARGVQVVHAFSTANDFKVTLTVTGNHHHANTISKWVYVGRPQGWTEETHQSAAGNYEVVFPQDKVLRMDIMISPENFRIMEDDLADRGMFSDGSDPVYVRAIVKFNHHTWWHVGIRYKGQSTLFQTKMSGNHKYPFHLNFNKFDTDYPEIKNQNFYGFKELLCNNCWFDASFIRDAVVSDVFRDAGIPTARCSFCRVYVDTGSGPIYWGLYTIFEDHADQLLKTQFKNPEGNLYKPEGRTGADWQIYNQDAFVKKTNKKAEDWSDVQAAFTALHADRSDAAAWRTGLESVFDVTTFLRWLAINTVIVNWDSYGRMAQNYFLYQDLANNGRLVWIPWDFNMALSTEFGAGPGTPPDDWVPPSGWVPPPGSWEPPSDMPRMMQPLSLSLSEVDDKWPLIRFMMDDPLYRRIYLDEMRKAMCKTFNETVISAKMCRLHQMIRPYVVGTDGEISGYTFLTDGVAEFDQALTDLLDHVSARQTAVREYLQSIR